MREIYKTYFDPVESITQRCRCDLCGRYRKIKDTATVGNEDQEWIECKDCMSASDLKTYFPNEVRNRKESAE